MIASPSITRTLSWLKHCVFMRSRFSEITSTISTRAVISSPRKTGALNSRVCDR